MQIDYETLVEEYKKELSNKTNEVVLLKAYIAILEGRDNSIEGTELED